MLQEDQGLYDELEIKAFEVQVGIHELLGHGTGKLFQQDSNGQLNFPDTLLNPVTGEKIKSWYQSGETYDSKFQSFASTMEVLLSIYLSIYLPIVLLSFNLSINILERGNSITNTSFRSYIILHALSSP